MDHRRKEFVALRNSRRLRVTFDQLEFPGYQVVTEATR